MRDWSWGVLLMFVLLTECGVALPSDINAASTTYLFTLEGPGTKITFMLPISPVPDGYGNHCAFNENSFCEVKIPVTVNGELQSMMTTFYGNGGLSLSTGVTVPMVDLIGPHLFTGTLWKPTFTPGTYTLERGDPRFARLSYTLTVSPVILR